MKKKIIVSLVGAIIAVFLIAGTIYKVNIIDKIEQNSKQQEEIVKDISYEVYYHIAPVARMLIRIEDTQNGIEKIVYPNNAMTLNCNGKNKVAIDYEINTDETKEFTFVATNTVGEQIEKTIVIDDAFYDGMIDTNLVEETETQKALTIDYKNGTTVKQYRIGETRKLDKLYRSI